MTTSMLTARRKGDPQHYVEGTTPNATTTVFLVPRGFEKKHFEQSGPTHSGAGVKDTININAARRKLIIEHIDYSLVYIYIYICIYVIYIYIYIYICIYVLYIYIYI